MPAENDPAEPNALTQSLQLICSLTPKSTVPNTRLVIIWLKRCLARSLTDPPLESAPVGVGDGVGDGEALGVGIGVGVGEPQSSKHSCADAGADCIASTSQVAPVSATNTTKLRV